MSKDLPESHGPLAAAVAGLSNWLYDAGYDGLTVDQCACIHNGLRRAEALAMLSDLESRCDAPAHWTGLVRRHMTALALNSAAERWHADGNVVKDENGFTVALVAGQDEDNSDTVLLAAAPRMLAALKRAACCPALTLESDEAEDACTMRDILEAIKEAEGE